MIGLLPYVWCLYHPGLVPLILLIPTSSRSNPVLSATSSTWSSHVSVGSTSLPSNSCIALSVHCANACLAEKDSSALITTVAESLCVFGTV